LDDPKVGEVARSLYDDARKMLDLIVKENWFKAQATIGFWPANAQGDDIIVYADDTRKEKIAIFHTLRQQLEKREGRFNTALSDFIAPVSSGVPDYIGSPTASRTPMTITPRSCARPWRTASPKPLPSGCTRGCAGNSGALHRTRRWRPTR
jgi:hypothetical protein